MKEHQHLGSLDDGVDEAYGKAEHVNNRSTNGGLRNQHDYDEGQQPDSKTNA